MFAFLKIGQLRWFTVGFFAGCLGLSVAYGTATNEAATLRPFYIIGHGANTLDQAREYLAAGVNGLEIDVNLVAGETNALCIGHGPHLGGAADKDASVPLAEFLCGLHALARTNNLCLIYFDCKTLAATPERGAMLLQSIRDHLEGTGKDRLDIASLISVGKLKEKAMFADITRGLGPREGLMVDGYSDPVAVNDFFGHENVSNQAFCDGIVPVNTFMSQFAVAPSVERACRMRDSQHQIRFVGTWSVNNPWWQHRYIKMGVDGIVTDGHPVWYNFCWANWGNGVRSLTSMVRKHGADLGIRLATRADNPFATSAPEENHFTSPITQRTSRAQNGKQ